MQKCESDGVQEVFAFVEVAAALEKSQELRDLGVVRATHMQLL